MAEGFIVDNTYGGRSPAAWAEGAPEKSFWTGLSLKDRAVIEVTTWRCSRCGFLESYAAR